MENTWKALIEYLLELILKSLVRTCWKLRSQPNMAKKAYLRKRWWLMKTNRQNVSQLLKRRPFTFSFILTAMMKMVAWSPTIGRLTEKNEALVHTSGHDCLNQRSLWT